MADVAGSALEPLVSIVIPVYNGANFLRDAIDSALAQTYPAIEVLVVNDGSTDGGATEAIALSYRARIRYFAKPNGHVASALNFGIAQMRGAYFSWLSHDDLYHPEKLAAQVEFLRTQPPASVAYCDFEALDAANGARTPVRMPAAAPEHFRHFITLNNCIHGCTLLIPKRCLDEAGPFNETLRTTQDYDMWFRLARRCRFVHLPRMLVTSRHHAEQGSHALRGVAQAECDRLLEGFVRGLDAQEVAAGAGARPARAYATMAANLSGRGFAGAAAEAAERSRAALREEPPLARVADAFAMTLAGGAGPAGRLARRIAGRARRAAATLLAPVGTGGSVRQKFSAIYRDNVFGGTESRSGGGSSLEQTAVIRRELPLLMRELGVKIMIDAPCGDFHWMQHTELQIERYVGIDIVEELIERDRRQFGGGGREFLCLNIIDDPLPRADLIFCRDCLVHLDYAQARKALRNFRASGATWLLTTTFSARERNVELAGLDIWRTLNLERAPFCLPAPHRLINEGCTEGGGAYGDKCLGLWRLQDLTPG